MALSLNRASPPAFPVAVIQYVKCSTLYPVQLATHAPLLVHQSELLSKFSQNDKNKLNENVYDP